MNSETVFHVLRVYISIEMIMLLVLRVDTYRDDGLPCIGVDPSIKVTVLVQ